MNAGAVIVRELRAESRRAANYWLRVLAAGVLITVFASTILTAQAGLAQLGYALFSGVNQTLYFALWILVPLMTADCISRERREGTLGLLFLTPLTVSDVIAGKAIIHVLRAVTLFLSAVPLLGLPLVLGGVDWRWLLGALVGHASAVLLGIAAGIYASTRGGSTIQVMVMAEGFALLLAVCSFVATRLLAVIGYGVLMGRGLYGWYVASSIACSAILFATVLIFSVKRVRVTWDEEAAAPEQPRWVKIFSDSEFWRSVFKWDTSRTLDHNPVAWLQEYSWTARLTKWGWLGLVLVTEFFVLTGAAVGGPSVLQPLVVIALGLGIAFSAVGSFRREQETGMLELLLVTPLTDRQFLRGRFWGICCHFLPALAVLWVGWIGNHLLDSRSYKNEFLAALSPHPAAYLLVVMLGLYLSLGRMNFFLAWFLTWALAFAAPILAGIALKHSPLEAFWIQFGPVWVLQLALAVMIGYLLERKLHRREFAVKSSERPLGV